MKKKRSSSVLLLFYPALTDSKTPTPQNSVGAKKLGGSRAVRKRPIGSTNNQWG